MASLRASVLLLCVLSVMAVTTVNSRKTWVMLLSGAKEYYNYSLQSVVFHACQTLMKKGIPASTIVHMNYNDVATNQRNPIKNNLVTMANSTDNWFPGCQVDYSKDEVTPELYLKVLSGDKDGVRELLGREGRVIESGPDDHVFVYMADHGSRKVFHFPNSDLLAEDLMGTLTKMHKDKKYAKMVIYMEACLSGSMFDGLLPKDINILATTSANPHESAYPCCYDKFRRAFVGGQWDNAWNYDTDKHDISTETFQQQYEVMWKTCTSNHSGVSHPSKYGDLSFEKLVLKEFQGPPPSSLSSVLSSSFQTGISRIDNPALLQKSDSCELDSQEHTLPYDLRHLPFSVSGNELFYQDINLVRPPYNMLEIATTARNLLEEEDPQTKNTLVKDLVKLTEIRREGSEFFESLLVESVGKEVADMLRKQTNPDVVNSACYSSALTMFRQSCPGLDPSLHTFVTANYDVLMQLCNLLPKRSVLANIETKARLSPVCWK